MNTDNDNNTDETEQCPVCGDVFTTHHERYNSDLGMSLRDDATFCAREIEGMKGKEQWVHVPDSRRSTDTETG